MSETYSDIVKEVKRLDEEQWSPLTYCVTHGCALDDTKTADADMALHLCKRVRDAVARDYKEWWVEDRNGEKVHIGDKVEVCAGSIREVEGFKYFNGVVMLDISNGLRCFSTDVVKVTPDTREGIIKDAAQDLRGWFENDPESDRSLEMVISRIVDRAMKLGDDDA